MLLIRKEPIKGIRFCNQRNMLLLRLQIATRPFVTYEMDALSARKDTSYSDIANFPSMLPAFESVPPLIGIGRELTHFKYVWQAVQMTPKQWTT